MKSLVAGNISATKKKFENQSYADAFAGFGKSRLKMQKVIALLAH
jgi:hypothetical protein